MKLYQVYETYQTELQKYAFSLCRQWQDAEDLVQQVYIKALEQYELFEVMHPLQIRGWLYTTLKRHYIDTYRRQQKWTLQSEWADQPHDAFIEDELLTNDLLEKLPVPLRKVVYLSSIEGYNSQEIGELLGLNPSTVRSRLSSALVQLKKELCDERGGIT